jgi:hypothetical protein
MKVGEIWNDKEDGTKVKIVDMRHVEQSREDILTVEVLDDVIGFNVERNEFLEEYEKTTLERV